MDIATRSTITGRALIENDREKIARDDLTRLFVTPDDHGAGFVERVYGGDVLPTAHATFLDAALPVARATGGAKGALLMLLLMRFIVGLRPAGNWGARTVIRQMGAGEWEALNPNFLRDHVARAAEAHPLTLLEPLRMRINRGVFGTGLQHQVFRRDAVEFLREAEGDVVYLDPPYSGTSAYESALKPLDSILAGRVIEATPSRFSGRHAVDALEELLEAAAHIPHLVLSYGNRALAPEALAKLVSRHRHDVRMEVIRYQHLAGLASEASREQNREVLISAGRGR
jgi:hypothetical protein